jgi:hypothetical protein
MLTPAQEQFLNWLENVDNVAYQVVVEKAGQASLGGLLDALKAGWTSVKNAAKAALPAIKETAKNAALFKAEQKIRDKYLGGRQDIPLTGDQMALAKKLAVEGDTLILQQQAIENQRILNEQIRRAEQNLPPLQTPNYRALTGTVPQTFIQQAVGATTRVQMIPLAIAGGAAIIALILLLRRR